MGRPASSTTLARGITLDWTYLALAAAALALVALTTIRTETGADVAMARSGGLNILAPAERVVAFEDDRFAAADWSEYAGTVDGQGRVVGPLSNETLEREFSLPSGSMQARLGLDVILWSDGAAPDLTVNGTSISPTSTLVRTLTDGTVHQRLVFTIPDPGQALHIAITGAGNGRWAIDNLSLIVALSGTDA